MTFSININKYNITSFLKKVSPFAEFAQVEWKIDFLYLTMI